MDEYWVVDPIESSLEIYHNEGGEFVLYSRAEEQGTVQSFSFTGLVIEMSDIFDAPQPTPTKESQ